jgi:hypothetical protein
LPISLGGGGFSRHARTPPQNGLQPLKKHDAVRSEIRAEETLLGARRAFKDAHQQIVRVAPLGRVVFDHHSNVLNVLAEGNQSPRAPTQGTARAS